jgi:hypothetical protein
MKIDELQPMAQQVSVRRSWRQQSRRRRRLPIVWLFLCVIVSTTTTTTMCLTGNTFADALLLSPTTTMSVPLLVQQQSLLPTMTMTTTTTRTATSPATATVLRAANNNNDNDNKKNKKLGSGGIYVRPSGAIERGSGFFVPGLEGSKIKVVIGIVLLIGTAINHWLGFMSHNFSFSEGMAVVFSLLLLFQFAIEYVKESLPPSSSSSSNDSNSSFAVAKTNTVDGINSSSSSAVLNQQWTENEDSSGDDIKNDDYRTKVQWAAASYLSMTPSTQILLLNNNNNIDGSGTGTVLYRLGGGGGGGERSKENNATGVEAALNELRQSKGGRIALPLTHPAVQALLLTDNVNDNDVSSSLRTVILQRITDDSCWMVGSDQLLAGYTSGDLKWLGQLAKYVAV